VVEDIDSPDRENPIEMELLSVSPRVFIVHNFMSESEMEKLMSWAQDDANP
jgi:hypothetical protein